MKQNLNVNNLNKKLDSLTIFKDLSISIPKNHITCILGPSGCGKTTLLNIISGIEKADSGTLDDFKKLTYSYVFQDARLLPWKSIRNNLEFVLRAKFTPSERSKIIDRYLEMVELTDFKDYYPGRLSGGMRQRASIARAFAYPSDVLIMDEPFKGLDIKTKKNISEKFLDLWNSDKRTVIFVTHDIEECLMIADKIIVLSKLPTKAIYESEIPIPHNERDLNDPEIVEVEKNINKVFFQTE